MKTKILTCRFCWAKTGQVEFNDHQEVPDLEAEILDIRCGNCETEYGNYKKMEQEFIEKGLFKKADFQEVIKQANYKKQDFDTLISKL